MAGSQKSTYTPKSSEISEKTTFTPLVIQDKIDVRIESLVDAHLVYNGLATGQRYEWLRAGAIVSVDEADVSDLLGKRLGGKTCCGSQENKIFQLAK